MPVCARKENDTRLITIMSKMNLTFKEEQYMTKIGTIMNLISKSRSGFRFYKKLKYEMVEIYLLEPDELKELSNLSKEIIPFYYRLLSCMVNNFDEIFDNNNKINNLLEYCTKIKKYFMSNKNISSVANLSNDPNNSMYEYNPNLVNSTNYTGKSEKNNQKEFLSLSNRINMYENKKQQNKRNILNQQKEEEQKEQKYRHNRIKRNRSIPMVNSFTTATQNSLYNQGLQSKTNQRSLRNNNQRIYQFNSPFVNETTTINVEKVNKNKGTLMRNYQFKKLSQNEQKKYINRIREVVSQ